MTTLTGGNIMLVEVKEEYSHFSRYYNHDNDKFYLLYFYKDFVDGKLKLIGKKPFEILGTLQAGVFSGGGLLSDTHREIIKSMIPQGYLQEITTEETSNIRTVNLAKHKEVMNKKYVVLLIKN